MKNLAVDKIQKIVHLAGQIEDDIRQRGLKSGDRYLNTAQIARMLRSDTAHVNRALQLMAKRKILERRPRVGTFITGIGSGASASKLQKVRLLVFKESGADKSLLDTGAISGIHDALGEIHVQIDIIPESRQEKFLGEIQGQTLSEQGSEGFVLISSTLTAQKWFAASGLPAVIWGHPFPSIQDLCFVDWDTDQLGKLMVDYVAARNCRHVLLLLRNPTFAGDYCLMDVVRDEVHAAGIRSTNLTIRPTDADSAVPVVRGFLQKVVESHGKAARPAIIICAPPPLADIAVEQLKEFDIDPLDDAAVVATGYYRPDLPKAPYAIIQVKEGYYSQGYAIGKLLAQVAKGDVPEPNHILYPVALFNESPGH